MKKIFAVMLFYEDPLGDYEFIYQDTIYFKDRFMDAINFYSNTPCPTSQFIEAESLKDLKEQEEKMKANFKNKE